MRDFDSSDRIAVRFVERNSSSAGAADAVDYNYTWAAPVADSAEDSCISVIGKSVEDCRDS